jgi:uncharacterized protein (DUF1778 family)
MMQRTPLQLRLPPDLKEWIASQANINASSQNSEIIRAIRERMERTTEPLSTGALENDGYA